jgi:hypothetical protein
MGLLGINIKQPPVGHHFRAADVEGLPPGFRMFQAALQVMEHIADGNGLHRVVHPAGGEHDRQAVHQIPQYFKGSAARPENHGRPEEGNRHRAGLQNLGHLMAGAEMLAQAGVLGTAQSAQINDMFQSGFGRSANHIVRRSAVGFGKALGVGHHGVNQVKGRPAALRRFPQGLKIQDIAFLASSTRGCPAQGRARSLPRDRPRARTR